MRVAIELVQHRFDMPHRPVLGDRTHPDIGLGKVEQKFIAFANRLADKRLGDCNVVSSDLMSKRSGHAFSRTKYELVTVVHAIERQPRETRWLISTKKTTNERDVTTWRGGTSILLPVTAVAIHRPRRPDPSDQLFERPAGIPTMQILARVESIQQANQRCTPGSACW